MNKCSVENCDTIILAWLNKCKEHRLEWITKQIKNKAAVKMTKEETIVFAKKYLEIRKDSILQNNDPNRIWDLFMDYLLNDIIPYIYGEALD